ncbi:MAG: bifunctional 2-polyprenyl-6-hydroxyphenol methylase/3-demethylubiquinol 3-O-methyltransferase UbiG [Alphaproteobacteria bacterium]|nr:bifunctional 2-polyprenyl-6-hydroxyphenol methylase/3-demethylubiquinol 3-O-methyltransferase UbiG [Alphaproteobacteria bacterium]
MKLKEEIPGPAKTVDSDEIARFSAIADEWWNERGKFAPLHRINPLRITWIKDHAPLQSCTLLDIGCGGGLIAEPMARLGANVTAIDASEKNIKVAALHAEKSGLAIDYRCTTAEAMDRQFDVVLALEIIEHVADIPAFVEATCKLVKPGGGIFYSTLNRTAKSYALAIIGAEYILRWLPKGTHTWSKFVRPHELVRELEKHGIEITDMRGMVMNPLTFKWHWDAHDLSVNYAIAGRKK